MPSPEPILTKRVPGNAKIEGLEDSLGMSGSDYNIAVSMFCESPNKPVSDWRLLCPG